MKIRCVSVQSQDRVNCMVLRPALYMLQVSPLAFLPCRVNLPRPSPSTQETEDRTNNPCLFISYQRAGYTHLLPLSRQRQLTRTKGGPSVSTMPEGTNGKCERRRIRQNLIYRQSFKSCLSHCQCFQMQQSQREINTSNAKQSHLQMTHILYFLTKETVLQIQDGWILFTKMLGQLQL